MNPSDAKRQNSLALMLNSQAGIFSEQGFHKKAQEHYAEAYKILEKLRESDPDNEQYKVGIRSVKSSKIQAALDIFYKGEHQEFKEIFKSFLSNEDKEDPGIQDAWGVLTVIEKSKIGKNAKPNKAKKTSRDNEISSAKNTNSNPSEPQAQNDEGSGFLGQILSLTIAIVTAIVAPLAIFKLLKVKKKDIEPRERKKAIYNLVEEEVHSTTENAQTPSNSPQPKSAVPKVKNTKKLGQGR
jgi:tetratricopeptide (TPR) repeat protein